MRAVPQIGCQLCLRGEASPLLSPFPSPPRSGAGTGGPPGRDPLWARSWVRKGGRCSPGVGQLPSLLVPSPIRSPVQSQRTSHTMSDAEKGLVWSGQQENGKGSGTLDSFIRAVRTGSPWPHPSGLEGTGSLFEVLCFKGKMQYFPSSRPDSVPGRDRDNSGGHLALDFPQKPGVPPRRRHKSDSSSIPRAKQPPAGDGAGFTVHNGNTPARLPSSGLLFAID